MIRTKNCIVRLCFRQVQSLFKQLGMIIIIIIIVYISFNEDERFTTFKSFWFYNFEVFSELVDNEMSPMKKKNETVQDK